MKKDFDVGIHYFATEKKWVEEVLRSVDSLKVQMPNVKISIATDAEIPTGLFDFIAPTDGSLPIWQQKVKAISQSPFQKTIYLDSDTYICAPFWELFDVLDEYDLAAAMHPIWNVRRGLKNEERLEKGIPCCFPKLNAGVIAYKKTQNTEQFFKEWLDLVPGSVVNGTYYHFKGDQDAFRYALYKCELKWFVLPTNYNARLPYPGSVNGYVKICHDHHKYISRIAEKVNKNIGVRYFTPIKYQSKGTYYSDTDVRPSTKKIMGQVLRRVFRGFRPY